MTKNKIILYGHFGSGNIGNDSTLDAVLSHVKQYTPETDLVCVCTGPEEVSRRFGLLAIPMSGVHSQKQSGTGLGALVRRFTWRLMDEILFWLKRSSWFQPGDRFVVAGTGAVDDMAVQRPWHSPYELYKWCRLAKMGGAKVVFLSVGVGPILNRMSQFLMLRALRIADYRSYREMAAFQYLQGIGFDTTGDLLYPDLVFSFPKESLPAIKKKPLSETKVVGLGLINYYGWRHDPSIGEDVYQSYFSKIKRFTTWLFHQGYTVLILSGDTTDQRPVQELIDFINKEQKGNAQGKLIAEKITNLQELLEQIAQCDIVVASRFHNVLCALMLERRVISLGYHEKNVNLMVDMGLEKYCQHIEHFSFEKLVEQFEYYESEKDQAVKHIHDRIEKYRQLLDDQYRIVFTPVDVSVNYG